MILAITNAERYGVLASYHRGIFSAIEQGQLPRAMRLLFEFAEDYCLNFENDVAALSERYQQIINAPRGETDPSLFLQGFHRLWIAMEDYVLAGFPPEAVPESETAITADPPPDGQTAGHSGALFDLKKALLFRSSQSRRPLVELKNVVRSFGSSKDKFELGPVNLTIPQGQIVGIVGPNGAGKTTLLRLIAGDLAQSSGKIDYNELISQDIASRSRVRGFWPSVRSKIAYVPPSPSTIRQNTVLALWLTGAAHGISPAELERQITVTMHKYGLNQYADNSVSDLSTGYRLRFELVRILFTEPSLLVLDEPLANLDRNAQLTVLQDLEMLSASVDTPRSIVISSQHIEEVASISDCLVFLSPEGKVLFNGRREEVAPSLDYGMFEISVTDRFDELETLLSKLGTVETDRTPISVFALFAKGTNPEPLLRAIYNAGLQVKSFRDLSDSIEMLLLLPRFKASRRAVAASDATKADAVR